jgi:hypothetical protein
MMLISKNVYNTFDDDVLVVIQRCLFRDSVLFILFLAVEESYLSLANENTAKEGTYDNPASYLAVSSMKQPTAKVF